jgi:HSP20 family protein
MAEAATKLPVRTDDKKPTRSEATTEWRPFERLRHEIDRLFEDFSPRASSRDLFDVQPFWPSDSGRGRVPVADVVEKEKAYEVTAELPGMDVSDIDVKFSNGVLTVKGEKNEEKEEKKKDYYMSERRFGSFQRSFGVPDGVDADKIEANFKNGVLTVVLPKSSEALKTEKSIEVK